MIITRLKPMRSQIKRGGEVRLGNTSASERQTGNLNTPVMLRVKNREVAAPLPDRLPRAETVSSPVISSSSDGPKVFSSRAGDSLCVTG